MKKVISLALALVMMLAVCVPAFAAEISNTAPDPQTAIVKTTTDASDSNYTVTIPAETLIPWNTASTELTYTVSAQLSTDKYLEVTVAGNGKMTDANGKELAYTLGGATEYSTTANNVVKNEAKKITINVEQTAWDNAIISEYQDTLTFTATVK